VEIDHISWSIKIEGDIQKRREKEWQKKRVLGQEDAAASPPCPKVVEDAAEERLSGRARRPEQENMNA